VLFHATANYCWLILDKSVPYSDLGYHLNGALTILDRAGNNPLLMVWYGAHYIVNGFYPALFHTVMAASKAMFGRSIVSAAMANTPFIALLLVSVYFAGKKIAGKTAGMLAAFLVMFYPHVHALSRLPLPDFALTAMVAVSFCLLLYTEGFTRTVPSLLFGLSLGLGMFTKMTFAAFLSGPLAFTVGVILFEGRLRNKRVIFNTISAIALGAGISALWYIPHVGSYWPNYERSIFEDGKMFGCPPVFSVDSLLYYARMLAIEQLQPFFLGLFCLGSVAWLVRVGERKYKALLAFSIAVTYTIFFLIFTKESKSPLPYLVYFSLISSIGIVGLMRRPLRHRMISLICLVGLVGYATEVFGIQFAWLQSPVALLFNLRCGSPFYSSMQPVTESISFEPVIHMVQQLAGKRGDIRIELYGFDDNRYFNEAAWKHACHLKNLRWQVFEMPPRRFWLTPDIILTTVPPESKLLSSIAGKYHVERKFKLPNGKDGYAFVLNDITAPPQQR